MNCPATVSCMGGWCRSREVCQHYVTEFRGRPEERLCEAGAERPTPLSCSPSDAASEKPHRMETN